MGYRPPFDDIRFVLEHITDLDRLTACGPFKQTDAETIFGLVEESGRFFAEVLGPLNRVGDRSPSHRHGDGAVSTPPGFVDAYRRYVEAGWGAVPFDPSFGGGGFPWLVAIVMQEMQAAANMAFSLAPLLTQGAIDLLLHHGDERQQQTFLPRMITGEWTGTMNLTEPDAGSDVGAVRTTAVPSEDGTWRLHGQKIFITYGEHDLAPQIVHLVLARTPGAPTGTRGISCFIVPKHLVNDDGSLGARNDVRCTSLEHKMGIHASPTAAMSFGDEDGAIGYLVGEENRGMHYMFTMMNNARLSVGLQGLAIAEAAYQQAAAFARDRKQGRAPGRASPAPHSISEHPDVRRMLLSMRAHLDAMRCLVYVNAEALDLARHHPDPDLQSAFRERADLLIPVTKAWCTDVGWEMASLNVQIHGGIGFIEESGVPQLLRDIRIASIYEGTNGIQAIDLVSRKLPMRDGAVVRALLEEMSGLEERLAVAGDLFAPIREALATAVDQLEEATEWVLARGVDDVRDVMAGASSYLRMFGTVVGGWLLARSAVAAQELIVGGDGDVERLRTKIHTARFYAMTILPLVSGLAAATIAGADDLDAAAVAAP